MDDTYKTGVNSPSSAPYLEALHVAPDTGGSSALGADSHLALMDHLIQGGMGSSDAEHTLAAISPALYDALASHPYGTSSRLTFHTEGDLAVTIEPTHAAEGQLSVAMDTLHDVFVHGMPYEGLETVRDGLGAEGAHLSDLALLDSFGHSATSGFAQTGFPHEAVQDIQQLLQQHVDMSGGLATVSRSEALQAYTLAAEPSSTNTLVLDNGSGRDITVSLDAVRSTMDSHWGLSAAPAQTHASQDFTHALAR